MIIPEYVSRTSDYLSTRFPNGSVVIVRHYRTHRENWLDGFSRNDSLDRIALQENPLPTDQITVKDFRVNGHSVTYSGRLITAFNTDPDGRLTSFEGHQCKEVTVDGKSYKLSDTEQPVIVWTGVSEQEAAELKAIAKVFAEGAGKIYIPIRSGIKGVRLVTRQGKAFKSLRFSLDHDFVTLEIDAKTSGTWIYICEQ